MKASNVFKLIFGLFLIAIAIGIFQSLSTAKDYEELSIYILMIGVSGFSGIAFIIGAIEHHNKL